MSNKKSGEPGKAKKIISLIVNVFIWLFVIFAVLMTLLAFASQSSPDGVPSIGGKVVLTVQTPSMEPTFNVGDIIICQKLSVEEQRTLKVDDVITFDAGDLDGDGRRDLNSHRIKSVETAEDGTVTYYTKGDHNANEDPTPVVSTSVICQWNGTRLKGLGTALDFLQQPTGFLIVVVLPLLLFFIYELIVFIRKFFEVKNSGKKQITAADEELIKQRAIEEYIRSQQMQNASAPDNAPKDPAPEAPTSETPAEGPVEAPASETPAEGTAEAPASETPAEGPVETPASETPAEGTAETPASETPAEGPAEPPTETPAEGTAEELSEKPAPNADV